MVSQTMIKAFNSVQAQLVKIPGLTDEQVEQIQAIITKNTQPKIKGTGKKTGYILFSVAERKSLKAAGELDGLAFGDVARLLGKNWREAEQSVRDSWNAQAKAQNPEPVKPQPANVEHHSDSDTEIDSDIEIEEDKPKDKPKPKPKPKSKAKGRRTGKKPKKARSDESESESESEY